MSKFKDHYRKLQNPLSPLPAYGLGEIVSYGGFRWEIIGLEPDEEEGCWIYDLKRVDGTDETKESIHELGLAKSYRVEKPGNSTHTAKWDSCVTHVKESGSSTDPYAVCTAMLGDETFKSMDDHSFDETIKYYMQVLKLGVDAAGPVPNSLLARQDLEGEKTTKSQTKKTTTEFESATDLAGQNRNVSGFAVWYYDSEGQNKCAVFPSAIDAEAYARLVEAIGFTDVTIVKGQVEQTGKQLQRAVDQAEDATETSEQKSLVENIKAIQLKRQKATIAAREKEAKKSFKDFWRKNTHE